MHESVTQQERPRSHKEQVRVLYETLQRISVELNAVLQEINSVNVERNPNQPQLMVGSDCRINMSAYWDTLGGPYPNKGAPETVKKDAQLVKAKEVEWGQLDDERVRKHYHPSGEEEASREAWKLHEREKDGALGEALVFSLLARALGDRYLVVRSSEFDDYFNGVDTLVVDKKTGETVCAFDEVVGGELGPRHKEKLEKNRKRVEQGEAFGVKYGLSVNREGKFVRTGCENLSGFALRLPKDTMLDLLRDVQPDTGLGDAEREVLLAMLNEARAQAQEVARDLPDNPQATARLEHISTLITAIETASAE